MIREQDTQLHQGAGGMPMPHGVTSRRYKFTGAGDDMSIRMPAGVKFAAIVHPVEALHVSFDTEAAVVTGGTKFSPMAADGEEPLEPIEPGEYINISHADGTTAIGIFYLKLEGKDLPADAEFFTTSDPG